MTAKSNTIGDFRNRVSVDVAEVSFHGRNRNVVVNVCNSTLESITVSLLSDGHFINESQPSVTAQQCRRFNILTEFSTVQLLLSQGNLQRIFGQSFVTQESFIFKNIGYLIAFSFGLLAIILTDLIKWSGKSLIVNIQIHYLLNTFVKIFKYRVDDSEKKLEFPQRIRILVLTGVIDDCYVFNSNLSRSILVLDIYEVWQKEVGVSIRTRQSVEQLAE